MMSAMRLKGADGSEIELHLTCYQFPEIMNEYWDANWLMISLRVQAPQGSWHTIDPALLTWEVQELAGWLEALASNQTAIQPIEFTEPCLAFAVTDQSGDTVNLQVRLAYEFRPAWLEQP